MDPILQTYIQREGVPTERTLKMKQDREKKEKHVAVLKQNTNSLEAFRDYSIDLIANKAQAPPNKNTQNTSWLNIFPQYGVHLESIDALTPTTLTRDTT